MERKAKHTTGVVIESHPRLGEIRRALSLSEINDKNSACAYLHQLEIIGLNATIHGLKELLKAGRLTREQTEEVKACLEMHISAILFHTVRRKRHLSYV